MGEGLLTQPFPRREGEIYCGDVRAAELAERFGTPLYVYDIRHIEGRLEAFRRAFVAADPLVAYSVKANGNLTILRRLGALGAGADVTSAGELFRALRAGIDPGKIVFAGVGKTVPEIRYALGEGIHALNVESAQELERVERIATELGVRAPFAVRVNPDVHSPTPHEYTRTGHATTKFGVPLDETRALYRWAAERTSLRARGLDVHIGSQIVDPAPYAHALDKVLGLADDLRADGVPLEFLDIGGGFGIGYDGEDGMDLEALAAEVLPRVESAGLRLILEPGRSVVGDGGLLLTRVQYVKRSGGKIFVVVDGGMSELIRPSHYGGFHGIGRVDERRARPNDVVDVVGPICESGDFLARERALDIPEAGELLAVRTVGAYGFAMASNYNGRRRPAEAMVDGTEVSLVRRRETLEDLIRGEEFEGTP